LSGLLSEYPEGLIFGLKPLSIVSLLTAWLTLSAAAQDAVYKIVFTSRQYQLIGRSYPQAWSMTLPDGKRTRHSEGECTPQEIKSEALPDVRLPEKSEHWNYPTSVSASPDGKFLLVGSEAGSSTSHFEDYWLFDRSSQELKYIGGGNEAKWSPDGTKILWSTPRELAPLGKIHVWVAHIVLLDLRTLDRRTLTSGVSYESNFFWCTRGAAR